MNPAGPQYLTRTEAAAWLRVDVTTLTRHLRPLSHAPREPGTFRFVKAQIGGVARIRVLAADVFQTLPQP